MSLAIRSDNVEGGLGWTITVSGRGNWVDLFPLTAKRAVLEKEVAAAKARLDELLNEAIQTLPLQ